MKTAVMLPPLNSQTRSWKNGILFSLLLDLRLQTLDLKVLTKGKQIFGKQIFSFCSLLKKPLTCFKLQFKKSHGKRVCRRTGTSTGLSENLSKDSKEARKHFHQWFHKRRDLTSNVSIRGLDINLAVQTSSYKHGAVLCWGPGDLPLSSHFFLLSATDTN